MARVIKVRADFWKKKKRIVQETLFWSHHEAMFFMEMYVSPRQDTHIWNSLLWCQMYDMVKSECFSREVRASPHFFEKTSRAEEKRRKIKKSDSDAEVQRKSTSLRFSLANVMAQNRHPSRVKLLFRRSYGIRRAAFMASSWASPGLLNGGGCGGY